MKKMFLATALCFSVGAMAQSVEEANQLFDLRGADAKNALLAADMFKTLADSSADRAVKGNMKVREAQALYYYGGQIGSKEERKSVYTRGVDAGEKAVKELSQSTGVAVTGATKSDLALAHYFLAINLGKWGQVNGISDSIAQLPKLFKNLEITDQLDESVEEYGSARTRGRVKHKVPAALARLVGLSGFGKEEAQQELTNAYDNTLVDVEVNGENFQTSGNSTTTIYLLDVLADLEMKDKFCEVLAPAKALIGASDEVLAQVNAGKVPEIRNDLNNLKTCLEDEKKCDDVDFASGKGFHRFAKKNCK